MTKHAQREAFFKILFAVDFHSPDEDEQQLSYILKELQGSFDEDVFRERLKSFREHVQDIDAQIESVTEGWKISRMAKVDLTILRLAVFEMQVEELDAGIAINEAVELAKEYGGDRSYAFVNGILAKI